VIVGSALVKVIEENIGNEELVHQVAVFVKALKQGVLAGHGEQHG
jgi:tryptophan synthase alpha subunit